MTSLERALERARHERVIIVDDRNVEIGVAPRHEMRSRRLPHRATFILVFDAQGRILVQQRTGTKDLYPGYFDLAAGGVVIAGESYDESAVREAHEELGIADTPLRGAFEFYYEDAATRCFGKVYSCTHEGPFSLQPEEVVSARFRAIPEVLGGAIEPLTPDTLEALQRYLTLTAG